MRKINIQLKEKHLRAITIQTINTIIAEFGKEFGEITGIMGERLADQTTAGKDIKENIKDLKKMISSFTQEFDGLDDLLHNIRPSEDVAEKNSPTETVLTKVGEKGAAQRPDGTWEPLD